MTLVLVCVASWLAVVGSLVSMFKIAARGDKVSPPAGWHASASLGDGVSQSDMPLPPLQLRRFSRRLYAVHKP